MSKDGMRMMTPGDVTAALGLLSRLPVPAVDRAQAQQRGTAGLWAYPLAGVVIGGLAALFGSLALWLGVPPALASGLVLVAMVMMTGAMHEDGLADSADGLWGGWDRARRLEIMRDSRIGAYGVIALVLSLGLRWQALAWLMTQGGHWAAVVAVAALSRAAMVTVMARLPHARDDGLSHRVGRPEPAVAWLAVGVAAAVSLPLIGLATATLILFGAVLVSLWAGLARQKIGGQTGDILGATQQITEIGMLAALCALT